MLTRREFSALVLATGGSSIIPRSLVRQDSTPATFFDWRAVSAQVRVAFIGGGNAMAFAADGEALVVDCKGHGLGGSLRREVEATGSRLVAAVNTHHHSDHTGGNIVFAADLPLIAHERCSERIISGVKRVLTRYRQDPERILRRARASIRTMAYSGAAADAALADLDTLAARADTIEPSAYAPTQSFDSYHEIQVGGRTVELHHIGAGHTDNDVIVRIPEEEEYVIHAGDLLFNGGHPLLDVGARATSLGWQRCLKRILELADPSTYVVPGHGAITLRHALTTQWEYFERLRDAVGDAIAAGMSREQTMDIVPGTQLEALEGLSRTPELEINLGAIYDEMT